MASLNEQLTELQTARDNMKVALENKGQSVTKDIRTYANAISNIVSGSSNVKQFATEEELYADIEATEGDLAVVYGEAISNMTATTEAQLITFPATVVLPEAIASEVYGTLRAVDENAYLSMQLMLSASSCEIMAYGDSVEINITYTSEDGITYTRTDGGAETVDFGTTIKCYYEEEWNDAFGYFMQASIYNFNGLYKYTPYLDETKFVLPLLEDITYTDDGPNMIIRQDGIQYDLEKVRTLCGQIKTDKGLSSLTGNLFRAGGQLYFAYTTWIKNNTLMDQYQGAYYAYDENGYIGKLARDLYQGSGSTINSSTLHCFALDLDNMTYVESSISGVLETSHVANYMYCFYEIPDLETFPAFVNASYVNTENMCRSQLSYEFGVDNGSTIYNNKYSSVTGSICPNKYEYRYAPMQLTIDNANQLLPGRIAYGKNGVVAGDGSIYDNLDTETVLSDIFNLKKMENSSAYEGIPQHYYRLTRANQYESVAGELRYYKKANSFKDYLYKDANASTAVFLKATDYDVLETARTYNTSKSVYYSAPNKQIFVYNSNDELLHTFDGQVLHFNNNKIYYSGLFLNALKDPVSTNTIYVYDMDNDTNTVLGTIPGWTGYSTTVYSYNFTVMMNYVIIIKHGLLDKIRRYHLYSINLDTDTFADLGDFTMANASSSYKYTCGIEWVSNTDEIMILFAEYSNQVYQIYNLINDTLVFKTTMSFSGNLEYFGHSGSTIAVAHKNAYKFTDGTNRYAIFSAYKSILIDFNNSIASYMPDTRWYKDNVYLEDGYSSSAYIYLRKWNNKLFANYSSECEATNVTTETIDGTTYQRIDITDTNEIGAFEKVYLRPSIQAPSGNFYVNNSAYIVLDEITKELLCNGSKFMPKDGLTIDLSDKTYIICDVEDPDLEVVAVETNFSTGDSAESLLLIREPQY